MEKVCEFCVALRPLVYCKADAAYLCLSCDAKVHSANVLFNRHLRTLLCDSCRYHPAYAQCLDHRMLMCHGCDRSLHEVSSRHQKRVVCSYLGCPSAKDFASLWGFEFGELDKSVFKDQLVSTSISSVQPSASKFDIPGKSYQQIARSSSKSRASHSTLVSGAESEVASGSQQPDELSYKGPQQESTCFILEQIIDLKRLQLTDVDSNSPIIRGQEQKIVSSSMLNTTKKLEGNLNHSQHSQDIAIGLQQTDCQLQGLKVDSLPLPFSQPEHLPFFSTAADALLGESFWPCKSPIQNSQLWSQNMQDLGVCEDIICHDEFNMPDVDKTFSNFEELFRGDQDPIEAFCDGNDLSCFYIEKDMPLEKSNNSNGRARKDASAASSVYISHSVHIDNDKDPSNQAYNFPGSLDSPYSMYSISRHGAESRRNEYPDNEISPYITNVEAPCHSSDLEGAHTEARENAMMRYKEKKKARMHDKQIRYTPRKPKSDIGKRGNGWFVKPEGCDSATVDVKNLGKLEDFFYLKK